MVPLLFLSHPYPFLLLFLLFFFFLVLFLIAIYDHVYGAVTLPHRY